MNYLHNTNALNITVKNNISALSLTSFVCEKPTFTYSGRNNICSYGKVIEKLVDVLFAMCIYIF